MEQAIVLLGVSIIIGALIISKAVVTSSKYRAGIVEKPNKVIWSNFIAQKRILSKKILISNKQIIVAGVILVLVCIPFYRDILSSIGIHTITLHNIEVISKDGVESDFSYNAEVNFHELKKFSIYRVTNTDFPLSIECEVTEKDDISFKATKQIMIESFARKDIEVNVPITHNSVSGIKKDSVIKFTFRIR